MEDKEKLEEGWKKFYEFKGGKTIAVIRDPYNREEIMLLDPPHHIGVMDEERKEELLEWLVSLWLHRLHCVKDMDKKKKEKILRLLALLLVESES
jgi:hypothetical protein